MPLLLKNQQGKAILDQERIMLRHARWLLPLFFAAALPTGFVFFRAFVLLDLSAARWPGLPGVLMLAAVGGSAGFILCELWAWGIRHAAAGNQCWRLVALSGLLAAICFELLLRQPAVADLIWTAARVRGHPLHDFFLRNAAGFHLEAARRDVLEGTSRLQLVGSSQLNFGLDHALLQSMLPSMQVERRSLAGMGPARMLMISPLLDFRGGDVVLVYWSEFDMGAMSEVDAGWLRPFGNWDGLMDTLAHARRARVSIGFKSGIDMGMSALLRSWSMRDGLQLLLHRAAGGPVRAMADEAQVPEPLPDQLRGYADGLQHHEYHDLGMRAAETLIRRWREAGAKVVVLEGSINPVMYQPATALRRHEVSRFLSRVCKDHGAHYIPIDAQRFNPGPDDWMDGTHLNKNAMISFTRYVAVLLKELPASDT